MPANRSEIEEAFAEGINFVFDVAPRRFCVIPGRIQGLEVHHLQLESV